MDDTVNNFLKEINEIVPPKQINTESGLYNFFFKYAPEVVITLFVAWKECFDKRSGFPYYWNLQTDEVTWEIPEELKNKQNKKTSLYIPPKTLPGGSLPVPSESVKIYKIESESTKTVSVVKTTVEKKISEKRLLPAKTTFKSSGDSDDE